MSIRLLTLRNDLKQEGNVFRVTAGETNGTITDYSTSVDKREIANETVYAWDQSKTDGLPIERKVENITKTNTEKAFFGSVINMGENKFSISRIDEQGIEIKGNKGEKYEFSWGSL